MGILTEKKVASLILLFGLMFIGFFLFLNDLNGKDTLDTESTQYITDYTTHLNSYNIDELSETSIDETKETSIFIQDNSTGLFSSSDILGAYNFFNEQWAKISNVVYIIWSFPSFVFSLSGLPMGEIKWVINIMGYIMLVAFIYLVRKFISGT